MCIYIHVHAGKERVGVGEREVWVERDRGSVSERGKERKGVCVREREGRECE